MKLLTLNCHSWQEENQWEKISTLAMTIKEKQYDVIALQEVSQSIDSPPLHNHLKQDNFASVLLEELKTIGVTDYEYVWDFSHIGYETFEEGLAILSKHPITESDSFYVSKSTDYDYWKTRKIVRATISYKDVPLSFYSCHLGWWEDEDEPFQFQADQLLSYVKTRKELSFLMGDFNNNAFIRDEGFDYLKSQGLHDTYLLASEKDNGITVEGKIAGWDQNKEDLRLDIIFATNPVEVQSSRVIFNERNKPIVSDHYGVECEILM
ncbi:endonuclease/exonuclease/phosphatase family protein [Priestia koreensis]|uniref:endonuclease/exonuclease/phosphatase family protein n=1 Tax=Priestia koreensis TaxID=284581 RepID=UPI00203D50F9|nr:endonuclease/exonuclease/phosphatase family protein [Priestia koreensis]MCM3006647.1 endonuclease/exonuclease/phosphatase family protein [Priestia koreensis]